METVSFTFDNHTEITLYGEYIDALTGSSKSFASTGLVFPPGSFPHQVELTDLGEGQRFNLRSGPRSEDPLIGSFDVRIQGDKKYTLRQSEFTPTS